MLNKLVISNFKVARNLELKTSPLTVLAGLNGSGKSTVFQGIAAIYQSYLIGLQYGLQLGGPLIPLGHGKDVLSEGASEEIISFALMEDGTTFLWVAKVIYDSNQLEFTETPNNPPKFILNANFQYLQADRIVPQTLYPQAAQSARNKGFLGSHGEYTVDFISRNNTLQISELRHCHNSDHYIEEKLWDQVTATPALPDQVAGWLQQISPGVQLQAESLSGTDEVKLQFRYMGTTQGQTRQYRPTHVGFGLTYCLPIIVACLSAEKDSVLLIENPEAHLHPQGQAKMGELLALCASDGVQIIVETHSDHVLNGIRLAVKNRILNETDVSLNFFTRDIESGDCYVETPSVLPNGDLSNWPSGFFDQWGKDLNALLG